MTLSLPFRAALVGCRGMGLYHARVISSLPEYRLIAGCDMDSGRREEFARQFPGAQVFEDFDRMLEEARPDVVVIVTNNVSHAPLTIRAAGSGVRGICCEKPMAACLGDGQAMLEAGRRSGTVLIVNHQRRMAPVFRTLRRLIEEEVIGKVELMRAHCAGDLLTDGTHLIDTLRHLNGDAEADRVVGQIYRDPPRAEEPRSMGYEASGGWRYGHPVETGAMALIRFRSGVRAEFFTGALEGAKGRYQDYEIIGTHGRLHRAGDAADPPLMIQTDARGGWQPVPIDPDSSGETADSAAMKSVYRQFARTLSEGDPHPLSGESALKDLELVMAVYESARLRRPVSLPLSQSRFPLELLIENGEM